MLESSDSPADFDDELDLLEAIRDGIYTIDEEGRITWLNEVALEEFDLGYSRSDLLGSHVSTIMPQEDVETCEAIIQKLLNDETKVSERCEITLKSAYGTTIPVELHLTVRTGNDGEFQGTVGVVRDITKHRQRQERLMVLTRIIRHNLRQKLNVIGSRIEHLEQEFGSDRNEHFEAINDGLQDLTELSEKALEVHRAMADRGRFEGEADAVETLQRVIERLDDQYPNAHISVNAPEQALVEADRTLETVIENLIENGVEHSAHESPNIEITVNPQHESKNGWTTITVADDGPGIPDSEIEPLANGRETPLQHGSGLGLWLVKWVIERFGGEVDFEDRSPRGSLVKIHLKQAGNDTASNPG